jgi:aspartate aminotransferase
VDNHGGKLVPVPANPDFSLNLSAIEAAITPKTKAVLINSPHNPTGAVYSRNAIKDLIEILKNASQSTGQTIFLISDEPYRRLAFDGLRVPALLDLYENAVVTTSFSKDLSIPGERIGYVAVNPVCPCKTQLLGAMTLANRILGFVNAPALIQRAVKDDLRAIVDVSIYKRRRDRLYDALTSFGYQCVKPEGAFYLFPKSPIPDDVQFVGMLQKKLILTVPGTGFGGPGYFRIAYCVSDETIEGSLKGFQEAIKEV